MHIKRSVKFRIRKIDQKVIDLLTTENKYKPLLIDSQDYSSQSIKDLVKLARETDIVNFDDFNKPAQPNPILFVYMHIRRLIVKILRKTVLHTKEGRS